MLCSRRRVGKVPEGGAYSHEGKVYSDGRNRYRFRPTIIVFATAGALLLWALIIYNRLVKNKNLFEKGWSGIDVQLKRRASLIEAVKGYMGHERGFWRPHEFQLLSP